MTKDEIETNANSYVVIIEEKRGRKNAKRSFVGIAEVAIDST